jgi:hypothetical protein
VQPRLPRRMRRCLAPLRILACRLDGTQAYSQESIARNQTKTKTKTNASSMCSV